MLLFFNDFLTVLPLSLNNSKGNDKNHTINQKKKKKEKKYIKLTSKY